MLFTTFVMAFTAQLTTNLETVLYDKNGTHFCQRILLKAATIYENKTICICNEYSSWPYRNL